MISHSKMIIRKRAKKQRTQNHNISIKQMREKERKYYKLYFNIISVKRMKIFLIILSMLIIN